MKLLGLDVGDKSIGISLSDDLLLTAQGRDTIFRTVLKEDIECIVNIVIDEHVDIVVAGMPKNMNGTIGPQAEKTEAFIKSLNKKLKYSKRIAWDVKVDFWDERLTTKSARMTLIEGNVRREDRKKVIDKVAAVYILQGYLDRHRENLKG